MKAEYSTRCCEINIHVHKIVIFFTERIVFLSYPANTIAPGLFLN